MTLDDLEKQLIEELGNYGVSRQPEILARFSADMTENSPGRAEMVIFPTQTEQVQKILRLCQLARVPATPVMANTNLGGLAIPTRGGVIISFERMNRILEINQEDLYAVIEPGVTWQQLHDHLEQKYPTLRFAYPLSPPESGIVPNCLLDGLANLSLRTGTASGWINALEVVLPTGELVRTGHWVYGGRPCCRAPFPALEGLFINAAGTTGVVTKAAVQLWPAPAFRRRLFFLCYEAAPTFYAINELARQDFADDIGVLSWAAGKMLFGEDRPLWRDPDEPLLFAYIDYSAQHEEIFQAKHRVLEKLAGRWKLAQPKLQGPLEVEQLVALAPLFAKFADFPTRLDFLLDGHGGGLSWVGTYGPCSRFAEGFTRGSEIQLKHGFSPVVVCRPMQGGHFGVLRWISVFDRQSPTEIERVRQVNRELLHMALKLGFFPYKTPPWAWEEVKERLQPGFRRLVGQIKQMLDPRELLNPDKLNI